MKGDKWQISPSVTHKFILHKNTLLSLPCSSGKSRKSYRAKLAQFKVKKIVLCMVTGWAQRSIINDVTVYYNTQYLPKTHNLYV